MSYNEATVASNLLNPATLSFCLGAVARFVRSDLAIPKDISSAISVFLLFSIGLKGGHELSQASLSGVVGPALATLLLGVLTPIVAFLLLRLMGRLSVVDSAAIAAHYGSVSVVTYIAAEGFVSAMVSQRPEMKPLEGYMPTLVALLESPGITVALLLGVLMGPYAQGRSTASLLHEVITGRTMFLLVGGLILGSAMGTKNWESIALFFDPRGAMFRGLLCIFLLEMGISAASRFREVRSIGIFMLGVGIILPVINAVLGVGLGQLSGLSVGGTAVLATMAASASYIAAPAAVRASLPDANPAYYLTLSLAITFPFNIIIGIPLYFSVADWYFRILA
ncbi:MAG: hypothetical protein RL518_750 [Pseudomonadota bacterium]|jgi:hypothetical protein